MLFISSLESYDECKNSEKVARVKCGSYLALLELSQKIE
jgi:hypothetical protein